jgi:hypothetical protein
MSEHRPCPFCGSTDVIIADGTTFRWLTTMCQACAAQGPEVRIQTTGDGNPVQWRAKATKRAWSEWDKRYKEDEMDEMEQANADVMRRQYRALTVEEKYYMDCVKSKGQELWDLLNDGGGSRELALAKTKVEEAVMWATKHITR